MTEDRKDEIQVISSRKIAALCGEYFRLKFTDAVAIAESICPTLAVYEIEL